MSHMYVLLGVLFVSYAISVAAVNASEPVTRRLLGLKPALLNPDQLIATLTKEAPYIPLEFQKWSYPHNPSSEAIFACAFSTSYMAKDATFYAGTARKAGYAGDIVVTVLPNADKNFLEKLKSYNVSVYVAPMECSGRSDVRCKLSGVPDYPVTLARYFAYQSLALKYRPSAYIMVSDFRDVMFQSNPFKNKIADWGPSNYDLVLFNEAHPNRVINRCPQTGGFMLGCYGKDMYRKLGANTVSSSGVIFGTRDAIVVYSHLITAEGDAQIRTQQVKSSVTAGTVPIDLPSEAGNKKCFGLGVDQTFHNYLLYSGAFHQLMRVKVFPQGEGPVNTLGGFYGDAKILRASLAEWKILRGEEPFKYVHNWNGEISSVVHQLDRYLTTELLGGYAKHLAILQHIK